MNPPDVLPQGPFVLPSINETNEGQLMNSKRAMQEFTDVPNPQPNIASKEYILSPGEVPSKKTKKRQGSRAKKSRSRQSRQSVGHIGQSIVASPRCPPIAKENLQGYLDQ